MNIVSGATERLASFGYIVTLEDDWALGFIVDKVAQRIKDGCNLPEVPDGLYYVAVDMVVGEFLLMKKSTNPEALVGIDLDAAVKRVKEGDTDVTFAVNEGSSTPEQRLDALISHLMRYGVSQFGKYRRFVW